MAEKRMLRGKAPLTTVRGGNGSFLPSVYRNAVVDPATVDPADRVRLVEGGFLEWVVRDGDAWKLAEDSGTGSAGDPVSVGGAVTLSPDDPDRQSDTEVFPVDVTDDAARKPTGVVTPTSAVKAPDHPDRVAARSKLTASGGVPDGRASQAVWVEYAVAQGRDYTAASALSKDELVAELKPKG